MDTFNRLRGAASQNKVGKTSTRGQRVRKLPSSLQYELAYKVRTKWRNICAVCQQGVVIEGRFNFAAVRAELNANKEPWKVKFN